MMGMPSIEADAPPLSAIQKLIAASQTSSTTTSTPSTHQQQQHLDHLALQIAHGLRFEHDWADIRIHRTSTLASSSTSSTPSTPLLARPMISGIPPKRLYIHPDEQIELLRQQKAAGKLGLPELPREREWVLPCHLRERWTLRKFGDVFDAIAVVPVAREGEEVLFGRTVGPDAPTSLVELTPNKWRTEQPKRVLLATLDDDSTVTYYIVHDGIVKPRQN